MSPHVRSSTRGRIEQRLQSLLLRAQRYIKIDLFYLTKAGLWLTLAQVGSAVLVFPLTIVFANVLPRETYGGYRYVLSVAGILVIPTLQGMHVAVMQAVARGYEGSFVRALKIRIKWGTLGGLGSLALGGYYWCQDNAELGMCFLLIALFVPLKDPLTLYGALLSGRKDFKTLAAYNTASQLIVTCCTILAVVLVGDLFLVVLAYFSSSTVAALIFSCSSIRKCRPNEKEDPQTISYGKHLSIINNVLGNLALYLDRLLIFNLLGASNVAIYSLAIAPVDQIAGVFRNIRPLALPKFSRRTYRELLDLLRWRIVVVSFVGVVLTSLYVLFAPYIYRLVFPKYPESVLLTQIFSIKIILVLVATLLNSMTLSRLTRIPKKLHYLGGIVPYTSLILLLLLLTPRWGVMGAVLSKLLFHSVNLGMAAFIAWRTGRSID